MPRLFTGIKIPNPIAQMLAMIGGKIKGARWLEGSDYHITLRFLGDIDEASAFEAAEQLASIRREKFVLQLDRLDVFGSKRPRTLYVGVAENAALSALQLEHEHLMQKIGLPPEARKYAPHITLARFGGVVQPHDVSRFLGERGEFIPMEFEAESFALFSARQSIGGGPYVVEREYPLS